MALARHAALRALFAFNCSPSCCASRMCVAGFLTRTPTPRFAAIGLSINKMVTYISLPDSFKGWAISDSDEIYPVEAVGISHESFLVIATDQRCRTPQRVSAVFEFDWAAQAAVDNRLA